MAKVIYEGSDPKWFEENMGRGGAIPLGKRPEPKPQSLSEQKQADAQGTKYVMKELDMTYLLELSKLPGVEQMSSDLTLEQRQAARRDINSVCNRIDLWLAHRGMPRTWLAEYGWPKVLDKIKELTIAHNINLTGL